MVHSKRFLTYFEIPLVAEKLILETISYIHTSKFLDGSLFWSSWFSSTLVKAVRAEGHTIQFTVCSFHVKTPRFMTSLQCHSISYWKILQGVFNPISSWGGSLLAPSGFSSATPRVIDRGYWNLIALRTFAPLVSAHSEWSFVRTFL